MSDEKNKETQQQPLGAPPVYPTYPQPPSGAPPYPTPMPAAYPLKDETPQISTAPPAFPVPGTTVPSGQQYQEQLFAACARGQHERATKFGTCGIITAIFCFPIGLLCLCADKEVRCARCGVKLN